MVGYSKQVHVRYLWDIHSRIYKTGSPANVLFVSEMVHAHWDMIQICPMDEVFFFWGTCSSVGFFQPSHFCAVPVKLTELTSSDVLCYFYCIPSIPRETASCITFGTEHQKSVCVLLQVWAVKWELVDSSESSLFTAWGGPMFLHMHSTSHTPTRSSVVAYSE